MLKRSMFMALLGISFVVFNGTAEASALDMLPSLNRPVARVVKAAVSCPKETAKTAALGVTTYAAAVSIPVTNVVGVAGTTLSSIALADSSAELGKCMGQKLAEKTVIIKPAPDRLK